jgi:hypothetical protein
LIFTSTYSCSQPLHRNRYRRVVGNGGRSLGAEPGASSPDKADKRPAIDIDQTPQATPLRKGLRLPRSHRDLTGVKQGSVWRQASLGLV